MKKYLLIIILLTFVAQEIISRPPDGFKRRKANTSSKLKKTTGTDPCEEPKGSAQMELNNVRALIHTGGDMWWDLNQNPRYEIPKGSKKNALFAGSIWIGGKNSDSEQLQVAAQRFRQDGNDFWAGPLDIGANTTKDTCNKYDRMWKINRTDVEAFVSWVNGGKKPGYDVPKEILEWPAKHPYGTYSNKDKNPVHQYREYIARIDGTENAPFAPYEDVNGNGIYDPLVGGDYPRFDLKDTLSKKITDANEITAAYCKRPEANGLRHYYLYGDQTIWWCYNDKGNVHTESKGNSQTSIGMEIWGQAFAFSTSDELNDMTFYNYRLINRSSATLKECYFGVWTDADLGYGGDDYVGCDVARGLGYVYNGKEEDGTSQESEYGKQPPAVGVDFFEGPFMDNTEEADRPSGQCDGGINGLNFGDGIAGNERWGMRRFIYFINGTSSIGDPSTYYEYYNYLIGKWRDNSYLLYDGNGHYSGGGKQAIKSDFMFPGDSDIKGWGTNCSPQSSWTEETAKNTPGDRRFVQSAGPFTLRPGATNDITTGVVWARASSGGPFASVRSLQAADDKAQKLFDECFRILDGPDAPELRVVELDQKLVFQIIPKAESNNKAEKYKEDSPFILCPEKVPVLGDCLGSFVLDSLNKIEVKIDSIAKINAKGTPSPDELKYIYNYTSTQQPQYYALYQPVREDCKKWLASASTAQKDTCNNFYKTKITYKFQGYQVYQLKSENNSISDIRDKQTRELDLDKARLVFQTDIKDNVDNIVNYYLDQSSGGYKPVTMVAGENKGIKHSFEVIKDYFSTGKNNTLVNYKKYYYLVVAYGYNDYKHYSQSDPNSLNGQKEAYLEGRRGYDKGNIKIYEVSPHKSNISGTIINSDYGTGPEITQIAGKGNSTNELELSDGTINEIMNSANSWKSKNPKYKSGKGPINIKIVDPLNVPEGNFTLKFDSISDLKYYQSTDQFTNGLIKDACWYIAYEKDGKKDTIRSINWISFENEQIVPELGISVDIKQINYPGQSPITLKAMDVDKNGLISSALEYQDNSKSWLSFVYDVDDYTFLDWIKSGRIDEGLKDYSYDAKIKGALTPMLDNDGYYETILDGGVAPYRMANAGQIGFALENRVSEREDMTSFLNLIYLSSVDIVITPDKSKWTRCPVVEMCDDDDMFKTVISNERVNSRSQGNALKFDLRESPSVDKNGNFANPTDPRSDNENDPNYISAKGMGWFPGYAIDIRTGERLNLMFGEDSWLKAQNGNDMKWNPTPYQTISPYQFISPYNNVVLGGKHTVFVYGNNINMVSYKSVGNYDAGKTIMYGTGNNGLLSDNNDYKRAIYNNIMYVFTPLFNQSFYKNDGSVNIPCEAKIKIRFSSPYYMQTTLNKTPVVHYTYSPPEYMFSTYSTRTERDNKEQAKSAMDMIRAVPNPYYGYSSYERTQIENNVKITNLPLNCTVSIYTINGNLVRQFKKSSEIGYGTIQYERNSDGSIKYDKDGNHKITDYPNEIADRSRTYIDWDLKNYKGIAISGGVYIIHIKDSTTGEEKVIKWFGALRPTDLNYF